MVNFILALIVALLSISGGSLLWPRLTSAPRPQILQQVHDAVIQTPMGTQAANVLGVADEGNVQPLNGNEIVGGAVGALKDAAEKRMQTIIMAQVTQQLMVQYEKLPNEQQQQLKEIICKPESE